MRAACAPRSSRSCWPRPWSRRVEGRRPHICRQRTRTPPNRVRAFIQSLIDEGRDEAQIKRALVGQYGPAALALPSDHGFDLAAYLVPLAACLALLAALAVLLPRWRRAARREAAVEPRAPTLSAADAARLD